MNTEFKSRRKEALKENQTIKRPIYFEGQLLSADDFTAEQSYHRDKHKRHNRYLHGSGVVDGLQVSIAGDKVIVKAGYALDCAGNEILVPNTQEALLPAGKGNLYILLAYKEIECNRVPVPSAPVNTETELMQPTRICESFELKIDTVYPTHRHTRYKSGWRACGNAHKLPIARLKKRRGRWHVDRRFRRPRLW